MAFKIASGKKKKYIHRIYCTCGFIGINCTTSFFEIIFEHPRRRREEVKTPHLGENANETNGTTQRFNYAFSMFPLKMSSGLNANVTKRQTLAGRQNHNWNGKCGMWIKGFNLPDLDFMLFYFFLLKVVLRDENPKDIDLLPSRNMWGSKLSCIMIPGNMKMQMDWNLSPKYRTVLLM